MRSLPNDLDLSNRTVVVKFFATWCGPCKLYAPVFERASERHPEAEFYELDVDSEPGIREEWGVDTVPTTIILKNREKLAHEEGALSTKGLDALLDSVLS